MKFTHILILLFGSMACSTTYSEKSNLEKEYSIVSDIQPPNGFHAVPFDSNSFEAYLSELPIKQDDTVKLYNGQPKANQRNHFAVIQIDVGNRDLQQCADAAIRLRAEYLFSQRRHGDISFHFTSGHEVSWSAYLKGMRTRVNGSEVIYKRTARYDSSYSNFRRYLDVIFTYCGTASLPQDVNKSAQDSIKAGNIYLQTARPYGHAVTVIATARNANGQVAFMLAQSYMPAQSIHILKNLQDPELSPWFIMDETRSLFTPEWTFPSGSRYSW